MIVLHEDADLFREAVRFTQSETGFIARLIEKDYFCSILAGILLSSPECRQEVSAAKTRTTHPVVTPTRPATTIMGSDSSRDFCL